MKVRRTNHVVYRHRWLFAAVGLIWLVTAFRIVNLDNAPLFIDEATYIHYAEQIITGNGAFRTRTTLMQPFLIAAFLPHGVDAPFVGRMVTVLAAALAAASCVQLGRELGGVRTGLLAGLLYAVLPLALFHERQALSDPVAAGLSLTALVAGVRQVRRPRLMLSVAAGLLLGLAYVVKLSTLLFFPLLVLAPLLLPRRPARRALAFNGLSITLGVVISQRVLALARAQGYRQQATVGGGMSLLEMPATEILEVLSRNAGELTAIVGGYIGWYAVALTLVGVGLVASRRYARAVLFAWSATLTLSLPWLIQQYLHTLPGRYLMTLPGVFAVLLALTLTAGLARVPRRWAPVTGAILLVPILGRWLAFDAAIPWDVQAVPLPPGESMLYHTGWEAGDAYRAAASDLLAEWRSNGGDEPLHTMTYGGCCHWQTTVYLGPDVGEHTTLEVARRDRLVEWLAAGDMVFFIDTHQPHFDGEVEDWLGADVEPFGSYSHGNTQLDVYRVTGAHGSLAEEVKRRAVQP